MPYYSFPHSHDDRDKITEAKAFCAANGINSRAPILGSTFEVSDDLILTREIEFTSSGAKIIHDGCCGSTHLAKTVGKYRLLVPPEDFGFEAMRTSDGEVAP